MGVFMVRRPARLAALAAVALLAPMVATLGASPGAADTGDDTAVLTIPKGEVADEFSEIEETTDFAKLRDAYFETRLLSGDRPLTIEKAAKLRDKGITASSQLPTVGANSVASVGGPWTSIGPDPLVQVVRTSNTFDAMAGRVAALVVRNNGTIILGAAQGGVWTYDSGSGTWTSRTQDTETQAVGALALAPSNDSIVYMGSGEGALSGDSYYGDGVYKSADGGITWSHVSGSFFAGSSVSDIVVDPANPDHLYISTLRGRGGIRRTTPPSSQPYGIWESTNGGAAWTLLKGTTSEFNGATDLVMDPLAPNILWASFWGDGIYRSTNGGKSWSNANGSLPQGQFLAGATRFSLGIAHLPGQYPVLYTGFDYFDKKGTYHPSSLWRNDSGGLAWKHLPTGGPTTDPDSILDYCTTQCFYDNVVTPDPTNPDIVYVAGSYGYDQSPQSGGIYRSTDGGQHWKSLGYNLHPDFHAVAFEPDNTNHVVIGNDGGVWQSQNKGGRLADGAPLSAAQWENLNGTVTPAGGLVHSTGLRISQFSSIATVPTVPGRYWGGTQDNGTIRKSTANDRWFDQASGDGGQVHVNPDEPYTYGTYTGLTPYRYDPDNQLTTFGNQFIDGGINTKDRAEFYVPWVMNKGNTDQLFLGSYRLYRTDNAKAASAGDVSWTAISGDLTGGCTGTAPNGARGCFISAVGVSDGGDGVYTGSDDGFVYVSPDAVTSDKPTWTRVGQGVLPNRPASQFAVDRSDWRKAYISYAGFSSATPTATGHVFKTVDGGQHWTDVTNNLPDVPVNSIVQDPAFPNTIYAGTDIGPYVTSDGGGSWSKLGSMPKVSVWQLDFDPSHRVLAAGTHGRGAYSTTDTVTAPALVVSKDDSGRPAGPGLPIDYTITVRNVGNADATGVTVSDPVPDHTTFVSAADGGAINGSHVVWTDQTVPAGGRIQLHFTVKVDPGLNPATTPNIVNDGIVVSRSGAPDVTGSPHTTAIAPAYAVSVDPAEQTGGAKAGSSIDYVLHVSNDGYTDDTYDLSTTATTGWTATLLDGTCSSGATTIALATGDTGDVCVRVSVPASAAEKDKGDVTLTVTSQGDPSVSAASTMHTLAVTTDTLLVDNDNNTPDVAATYQAALTGARESFATWDLSKDPELSPSYLSAHQNVVWFTGNSYPAPITPYEGVLKAYLDGGGRLFMSGQDILDQAAGTTDFVHDYLHINWNGTEVQNDHPTATVTGVTGNPVTNGIGAVPIDHTVLGATFEDRITPIAPATPAFNADNAPPDNVDALTVADGPYKVEFLAFPFEAYGTAAQKVDLMTRTLDWFGTP